MLSQGPLALETGEDTKGMNALGYPTRQRQVCLAQTQHLHSLDNPHITCRACRADGVMRTGDLHVEGDFTCRIVRYRPGVVVMRPVLGIVIVLADVMNFVLRLDISVLGDTEINADTRAVDRFQINPRIAYSLPATVDRHRSGPGTPAQFLFFLILQGIEITDTSQHLAHKASLKFFHSRLTREQTLAKLFEVIAVRGSQSNTRDNNTLFRVHLIIHALNNRSKG